MANAKKKGLFSRFIEGPERSEDYARSTLPTNRWALGWDLFKNNFRKIITLNLLLLLFVFPVFLLFILKNMLVSGQAGLSPFSQNMAFGYPAYPFISGIAETIYYQNDVLFFIALFVCAFYIAVGLSGGFYVMRNMVWTEGVFVNADFWAGVRKNYKVVLPSTLLYVFILGLTVLSIDLANMQLINQPELSVLFNITKIISYLFIVFFTITYAFMLTLGVTYELNFFQLIRNSLIVGIALLPLSMFFILLTAVPFLLLLTSPTGIIFSMGVLIVILFSLALAVLIWTNYSQWVFDEFINDKVAGAKKNRGIYKKTDNNEPEDFVFKKSVLTERPIKPVTDYDIELTELPESYSRADLEKLEASKRAMREDSDRYAEEHKDDYKNRTTIADFMGDGETDNEENSDNIAEKGETQEQTEDSTDGKNE